MPSLRIDLEASAALDRLYDEDELTATTLDERLDLLEQDPGDARWRKRQFRGQVAEQHGAVAMWGFTVRGRSEDYLVMWHLDAVSDTVDVLYIGPDVLPRGR